MQHLCLICAFLVLSVVVKSADPCPIKCQTSCCCCKTPKLQPQDPATCDAGLNARNCNVPTDNKTVGDVAMADFKDPAPGFVVGIVKRHTNVPICSGILLTWHFVLTSCIKCVVKNYGPIAKNSIKVAVGEIDDYDDSGFVVVYYNVKRITHNPGCFRHDTYHPSYDLAMVQTDEKINSQDDELEPARLPRDENWRAKPKKLWFLSVLKLMHAAAVTRDHAVWTIKVAELALSHCAVALQLNNLTLSTINFDHHYCTPYHHDEGARDQDGCRSDFGAPLYYDGTVFGLLIFKYSCGRAKSAAGFVNIAPHLPWLKATITKYGSKKEQLLTD